ncbi:MAG: DUF72 domain-containing protein, partial [Acidobacteria bacterium]
DLVEINATFYRAARPRDAERWTRTVEKYTDFRFTAKLHQAFTHDAEGAAFPVNRKRRPQAVLTLARSGSGPSGPCGHTHFRGSPTGAWPEHHLRQPPGRECAETSPAGRGLHPDPPSQDCP